MFFNGFLTYRNFLAMDLFGLTVNDEMTVCCDVEVRIILYSVVIC